MGRKKTGGKNIVLEVQKIVKWSLHNRSTSVKSYCYFTKKIQEMSSVFLAKINEVGEDNSLFENFQNVFAPCLHLPSQEPFHYEDCYKMLPPHYKISVDEEGKAMNVFYPPVNVTKRYRGKTVWVCSEDVCDFSINQYEAMRKCCIFFSQTTPKKLFCKNLKNELKLLNILKPHFPKIRSFVRYVYAALQQKNVLYKIDSAFETGDLDTLKAIADDTKSRFSMKLDSSDKPLSEDDIIDNFKKAFQILAKHSSDTPINECRSCQKILRRESVTLVEKLKTPLQSQYWQDLENFLEVNNSPKSPFVCNYCLQFFKKNALPPTCILNDLFVAPRPEEISQLNDFEKILIQRAKAFQVVHNMEPVANKRLPNRQMVKKVKGRTFHLPLPLQKTLEALPDPEDPIDKNAHVYIMVRGTPTKKKIIWEDLVCLNKIHTALTVLKNKDNKLYRQIKLPNEAARLLDQVHNDIEHNIEADDIVEPEDPFLRRIDTEADADYHSQYTIYPLHENRQNVQVSALYQMARVEAASIDNRDKDLDLKCFPHLFPEGKFGQWHERNVKLGSSEFIKTKLMSKHSQFRLDQQYLFFLLHDTNLRQLNAGIYYQMNTANIKSRLSAKEYLDSLSKGDYEKDLRAIFSRLRNTEQYWSQPRNDVQCMTDRYGPATWFLTVSPAEWLWDDLGEYIRSVNGPEMENKTTSELVALDPVSASRFIDNYFKGFLKFLLSEGVPLGKIKHYFYRREYQSRGLQHFHLLLWVEDAPVLGVSTPEEVCQFIKKYVTCSMPDKNTSPTLFDRVSKFQTHKHNSYCMRNKKTKNGFKKVCRFSFPRPESDSIVLNDVAESIASRKSLSSNGRLYNLPRTADEAYINDYNPAVLLAWNGNMDLQFVGEKSALLNLYVTKYTTKSEKAHSTDLFDQINSTKSLASRLYNVGLRALSHRECGSLEASDTLLSIPLYGTDRNTTIRWLDVSMSRNKRIKSRKEVESLPPESTDLFYKHFIDDYYPQRPHELDELNLYHFARNFDIISSCPKKYQNQTTENDEDQELHDGELQAPKELKCFPLPGGKFLKERGRPYLINHYKFNPDQDPEKFFHSLLLLYQPWRNTVELLNGEKTYAESFCKSKDQLQEAVEYAEKQTSTRETIEKIFEMVDKKLKALETEEMEDEGPDNPLEFQATEAENAMADLRDENAIMEKEGDVDDLILKLNGDQERVLEDVKAAFTGKKGDNFVLRHFVSGTGGTGKSFLIKTIKLWVNQKMGKNVAISAPTGVAAFNVSGLTIYRLFQLPVEHGQTPKFKYLSDHVLQTLRNQLENVELFIIDEISMVSNLTLLYIHLRLSEIFGTTDEPDGWFGKKHLLLFGDLLQLPPVHEQSPYETLTQERLQKHVGGISGVNLWTTLFTYDELRINMRQSNDSKFREALQRVRLGFLTNDDINLFNGRLLPMSAATIHGRLLEVTNFLSQLPPDTVCLLPKRSMCDALNQAMLNTINSPEIHIAAVDSIDCPRYMKKKVEKALSKVNEDSSQTAGLEYKVTVKIGCKIMLRRNIDVTLGLVNGSIGNIMSITPNPDNPSFPRSIKILFAHGLLHDLEPVKTKFNLMSTLR